MVKITGEPEFKIPERFELECPICKEKHEYSIDVDRSHALLNYELKMDLTKKFKRFIRVFICPNRNEQFQATIAIEEGSGITVNDVSVVGFWPPF